MKKLLYYLIVLVCLTSCSALKKSSAPSTTHTASASTNDPRFIETISIATEKQAVTSTVSKERLHKVYVNSAGQGTNKILATEAVGSLQVKYAILLDLPVESSFNTKMLEFIEEWYGTPYRFGGTTKKGIDCSAFVNFFMSAVYGLSLPRNSKEQYSASRKIKKKQLDEGDLIFFNTRGGVSHVGVYIGYNKFVHASTSSGVTISDLDDDYFARRYMGSGRVR